MASPAQMPIRGRLAPTPSGYLHLGNILNFSLNWLLIRHYGGVLRLRIDDLDVARMRPAYVEDIFRVLEWLGIDWDEGPDGPATHFQAFSQQLHLDQYRAALAQLQAKGQVFACTCSRRDIRALRPEGGYPGTCEQLGRSFAEPQSAWRLRIDPTATISWLDLFRGPQQAHPYLEMPGAVLRRKDTLPAYQIASLVDDQLHETTHVIRGADLQASTVLQLYLDAQLGARLQQVVWGHHPLLMNDEGTKYAKSVGSVSLQTLLDSGLRPREIIGWVADCLGIKEQPDTLAQVLTLFDPALLPQLQVKAL